MSWAIFLTHTVFLFLQVIKIEIFLVTNYIAVFFIIIYKYYIEYIILYKYWIRGKIIIRIIINNNISSL